MAIINNNIYSFRVSLNTHSVAFDKNLKEISVLIDDKEREYKPVSWSGGAGRHHIEGKLVFSPLLPGVKSVTLKISSIADVDRVFKWGL